MDERRYIEPAKNNALEHFRTVLQIEPGNAEATEGLKRLGGLLIARARTALDERAKPIRSAFKRVRGAEEKPPRASPL